MLDSVFVLKLRMSDYCIIQLFYTSVNDSNGMFPTTFTSSYNYYSTK